MHPLSIKPLKLSKNHFFEYTFIMKLEDYLQEQGFNADYSLRFHTAKERYEWLLKEFPDILLHTPLGHIASYLGITQQTLSVIWGQM